MENKVLDGIDFDFNDDENIMSVKSPQDKVNGPYIVVTKDRETRTAVVALDFDGISCLGRHTFTNGGYPLYRGHPGWEIITEKEEELKILNTLDELFRTIITDFLSNDESSLTNEELMAIGSLKALCGIHGISEQKTFNFCYKCYNKIKKELKAENREKEGRKINEKLEEIKKRFNSPTAIFSNGELIQEIEKVFEGELV